jgi:1-acyl-sn-glycerol-3-phosphate acyltransferase
VSATLTHRAVTSTIKGMTQILCRIEGESISQVPMQGPLILVCNHVNFLDIPLVYSHLQPRQVTGFVKLETWDNPLLGPLFDLWEAIPIRRGEVDREAIRRGLEALNEGKILAISPEGTRSGNGRLERGHPGVSMIALLSGAPLLPLVYYGGETFHRNVRQFQRTDFHIRVGRLFHVRLDGVKATRSVRQTITDEIMYRLASLLPPEYRGVYADLEKATTGYLEFQVDPA